MGNVNNINIPDFGVPAIQATPEAIAQAKSQAAARAEFSKFIDAESEFFYDTVFETIGGVANPAAPWEYIFTFPNRRIECYKTPVGQLDPISGVTKDYDDTNQEDSGKTPKGNRWLITDIGVQFLIIPDAPEDPFIIYAGDPAAPVGIDGQNWGNFVSYIFNSFAVIMAHFTYFTYKKQVKERVLGKLAFHSPGYGINSLGFTTNGLPAMYARRKLQRPILLEAQDSFSFNILRPRTTTLRIPWKFDNNDLPQEVPDIAINLKYEVTLYGHHDQQPPQ